MRVNDTPSLPNTSDLVEGLRVKLSSSVLAVASSSEDELGVLSRRALAGDTTAAIIPLDDPAVRQGVASEAITLYQTVYAAASGKLATSGTLIRGIALEAASGNNSCFKYLPQRASITGTVARSNLVTDAGTFYVVPLSSFEAPGTGAQLGATAGTPAGALGLTIGTHGTNTPLLVGEAASGNSKTDSGRVQFILPAEYVSGGNITLRVRARVTGNVQVAQTIDALCYVSDGGGGVGSDICATAAQTVTASFANYDFTITPTSLVAGDTLDILLTGLANDTGGTANKLIQIGKVSLLLDVKG